MAVVLGDVDARRFARAVVGAQLRSASTSRRVDADAALASYPTAMLSRRFDGLPVAAGTDLAAVWIKEALIYLAAYPDNGRGSGHPAGPNVGDRRSYALAADRHEPPLFKGNDCSHTDDAVVEV